MAPAATGRDHLAASPGGLTAPWRPARGCRWHAAFVGLPALARGCGPLGRQAADVARGGVDPLPQRLAVQACRVDEDHALHGAPGEVHRPDVRLLQCTAGALGAE